MDFGNFSSHNLLSCIISTLLVVYGCFRSVNSEERGSCSCGCHNCRTQNSSDSSPHSDISQSNVHTLDSKQAILLPLGASVSLLVMFFFFDSLQVLITLCTAVITVIALAFLLRPMVEFTLVRMCRSNLRRKFPIKICFKWKKQTVKYEEDREPMLLMEHPPVSPETGETEDLKTQCSCSCRARRRCAEIISFTISVAIVLLWLVTGHWLFLNGMGIALCVAFIAFVRLPSLKVSTLLLTGLLIYDVFWVFFSSYIFSSNVMVRVATRPADNPVNLVARRFHLASPGFGPINPGTGFREPPKLSLPGKLIFPSMANSGHFSMLGLGDIVMPGLLLCFVLRYDAYKKAQSRISGQRECAASERLDPSAGMGHSSGGGWGASFFRIYRLSYFHCSLIGYFLGLVTATVSSEVFKAAQPALLYLVPFTLLPLLTMAYLKGDLKGMWSEPFNTYEAGPASTGDRSQSRQFSV